MKKIISFLHTADIPLFVSGSLFCMFSGFLFFVLSGWTYLCIIPTFLVGLTLLVISTGQGDKNTEKQYQELN